MRLYNFDGPTLWKAFAIVSAKTISLWLHFQPRLLPGGETQIKQGLQFGIHGLDIYDTVLLSWLVV